MKLIAKAFLNNPVVFLGALIAAGTVLAEQDVIPGWISLVVVGIATVLQRHFVTPEFELDE